uniref:Uncharacterized protein n=1 Tax=Tanacetum cinerariifolium TaxID=118510 RepID=A0A6L2KT44_TANCI|nr:hypothetical protein [Tanacetum cinerariifolium]
MYYNQNVDFVKLLWEDFMFQVDNKDFKKQEKISVEKAIKRSKREIDIHQAGGSSEGAGLESNVPNEPKGDSDDDDDDQQADDERTKSDNDKAADLNKTDDEEEDEFVHTPDDYVPTNDENIDDEEYDRINEEMYNDVNVELKDIELEAPATTIPPHILPFIPFPQQSTLIPTPITEETILTTSAPDSETLYAIHQRLSDLENEVKTLKNVDHRSAIHATIKSEVPSIVKEYLETSLDDTLHKKSAVNIRKIKMEQARKQQETKYTITSFDTAELQEFYQKRTLFETMTKTKSFNKNTKHKALYHAFMESIFEDEDVIDKGVVDKSKKRKPDDADKDEGPLAGSNQGLKRKKTSNDAELSKKVKSTKTSKGTTKLQPKSTDKSEQAEETVFDAGDAQVLQNLVEDMGNTNEPPVVNADPKDWFKKPERPPSLGPKWNKCKTFDNKPTQKWLSDLSKEKKSSKTFNDLMSTPIDFSAFSMNRLLLLPFRFTLAIVKNTLFLELSFLFSAAAYFAMDSSLSQSGFFLIDRHAILDAIVWRHPGATIDDPWPSVGSFNMANMRRLSAHVIKLKGMPKGVLVLSGLSHAWKSRVMSLAFEELHLDVRSTLQRLPFYRAPPATADAIILDPTLKDLAIGTSTSKIVATAEAFQKRKASTSGATSSHVAKRTSNDDDSWVEIPLVTPLCFAAMISSSGNQGRSSAAPTAEDSRGKGIMVDDAAAPSAGASRSRPSSRPAPSFRDVSSDAIHTHFFPFSAGPYYATYHVDGVSGNCEFTREDWDAPYRPTFEVLTKELPANMSVLHCMMMSDGGELLARYRGLNQSHYEYVLSIDSRLKGYEEKVASLTRSKAKGNERKKKIKSLTKSVDNFHSEVARLSTALNQATVLEAEKDEEILRGTSSLAASAGFEHGLIMYHTKDEFAAVLKKMDNFMPGAQDRLAKASLLVAQTNYAFLNKIFEHVTEPLSVILQLDPEKLVHSANVLALREHNEEMVNVEVDGLDQKITDDIATVKSRHAFVQGISVALDDAMKLEEVGLGHVSFNPNYVVVALSAHEKGPFSVKGGGRGIPENTFCSELGEN